MSLKVIRQQEFKNFETRKRARFINSLSGFKSANLIGTIDDKKNTNLSIVSSAFHLGADPALMGIIIRPDISPRDTLNNIRSNKICTLNHVNRDIYQKAHQTSARYDKEISEFFACGLSEEYLNSFPAPFVKESVIKMSMELLEEKFIELNGTHMLILAIKEVYLAADYLNNDGYIDIEKAQTICVSGLDSYHSTNQLERLPYAKP